MSATLSTARSTLGQLLQETLHNDLLNFWGSKIHPLWSVDQALAQIVGRQIIAEGSITLTLKVNRNVQMPQAGQHLMVQAQVNGVWVSHREQACFVEELLCLQEAQPNFSLRLYLTQQQATQAHEHSGRITSAHFAVHAKLEQSHLLACGSVDFVQMAQAILPNVYQWQVEAFSPPALSTATSDQRVQITLQRQQRSLSVPVGQSILTALEAAGIAHPTGCHRHGWRAQRCLVLPRLWRIWKSRTTSCTANMTG